MENSANNNEKNEQKNDPNNKVIKGDNTIKDPEDWTTGEEPMTGAQQSYLKTLGSMTGEEINPNLTKAEASKKIEELQQKTGRGNNDNGE